MEQSRTKGRWFKLADAAQLLGVSEITVRRKAKSGQLKAILRNGRYMVFLEEDTELGTFSTALDTIVTPNTGTLTHSAQGYTRENNLLKHSAAKNEAATNPVSAVHDDVLQSLKRTIEDQQTLISSLEASISRLSQKLSNERYSSK